MNKRDPQRTNKSKDKISSYTKTPKLDQSGLLGKEMKPKSSMKRKLAFAISPPRNEERESDTDSDPGHSSETWGGRLIAPCRIYADKDGPEKKKGKKETGSKKSTPVNILFGYPLSERKQMALLMQMTARDNSPDSTPSNLSQAAPVQKKSPSATSSRHKDKVNKRNERGETALHMAAIRGDAEQVKELIAAGADVNVKDFAGWTPLHEACNLGYYDVAKVLIAAGAEVNTQGLDDDTPLHDASSSGHKDIVKLLLQHGGNAFQANKRGERPVDVADSKELEKLLKGEAPLADSDNSSSESEEPSGVDDNKEYTDIDSKQKNGTEESASRPGLDEYEFKDEEEEEEEEKEDSSKSLNKRHMLRREPRQQEKDERDRNRFGAKQDRDRPPRTCKLKNQKTACVLYCSSEGSSDETSSERRSSSVCSLVSEGHAAEGRAKKETNPTAEQKQKGKVKIKNKNQSKNKENQELKEDRDENSKVMFLSSAVAGLENPDKTREEDSFKMSFSPKDEDSVHLFHLSSVMSPKRNHSTTDKMSTPLKLENLGSPSQVDSMKYNHHVEPDTSMETSSTRGFKHKEKSKHHHKDLSLDHEENTLDSTESALQKTDKEGKIIKKHKLKHQENERHRKENETETEKEKHRQSDYGKDGRKNLEFDREFWKENFFKSDENDELLLERTESPPSAQKTTEVSLVKEERAVKEKHPHSKDKRQKDEQEKDRDSKKEKELPCKEERRKEVDVSKQEDRMDCCVPYYGSEDSPHNTGVKEELEDQPITGTDAEEKLLDTPERGAQDKMEKRFFGKEKESEKVDKKHSDREKRIKTQHFSDKNELPNCREKWREREKAASSHSPIEKNHKESEKAKASLLLKKPEDNQKSKDKLDRKIEKEKQEKERYLAENRNKEKNGTDKKGKTSEKVTDIGRLDRLREKERDCEKKKKDKIKDITSSSSNLKLVLEEKKNIVSESNKTFHEKVKLKEEMQRALEKDGRERDGDRDADKYRERDRPKEKSQQMKTSKTKVTEVEAERTKPKSLPAPKNTRQKEKRLVNDDLMQTSFERMLSLKDQEIEQWHRKHKEKIKQKERERMKHQPGPELSKLKNKDKLKSSSGEPCVSQETVKEATSAKTLSLDTKSLSHAGKTGLCLENSINHSPRPETEKSGLMSRSASLISVASSEDSCQAAALTPRPLTEHDSDSMLEGLDSQPSILQSSSTMLSGESAAIHEKESEGSLDLVHRNRSSLLSRQESPTPRSKLDEDGKPVISGDRGYNEPCRDDAVSSGEHSQASAPVNSLASAQGSHSSQALLPRLGNCSSGKENLGNDSDNERNNPSCHLSLNNSSVSNRREPSLKDSDQAGSARISLSHSDASQWPATDVRLPGIAGPVLETNDQCTLAEDSRAEGLTETTASEVTSVQTKESLPVDTTGVFSLRHPSQKSLSTMGMTSDCCGENEDVCSDCSVILLQREERGLLLPSEPKANPTLYEDTLCTAGGKFEDQRMENGICDLSGRAKSGWESSTGPLTNSISSTTDSTEDCSLNASASSTEANDTQEGMETDGVVTDYTKQKPLKETIRSSGFQSYKNESGNRVLSTVLESSPDCKHQIEEMADGLNSEGKSGSGEMGENMSLPAEGGLQAHIITDVEIKLGEETSAILAPPEEKLQHLHQGACDSMHSSAPGDLCKEHSGVPSGHPPQAGDGASDASGAKTKVRLLEDDDAQVQHPRKRKLHRVLQPILPGLTLQQSKEKTQQSLAAIVDSLKLEEIQPYQTERANPYYEFLHIRKKIEEKRKVLCSVIPQAPQYYDEYVTFNGSYLLDGNPLSKLCIPTITPPPSLPEPLKEMFKQQEVVRMKLRLQHSIEREKLIVSNEQEVLRVHYRAARTLANQSLPFSACTVLLDAEVYNMPPDAQGDDCKTSVRDRFNARQFMSWLQDVDDKFDKLKTCLLMRQQHEAAALNAVQRLEWQLKLQELDPTAYKSTSIFEIPEFYIPLVDVSDDFELAPI
ncbi:ankyrin repeat domain-containing protein 12-like isoform X2 [Megalops cyprinoides]|uniref:ankyrin repeat domain-containing protein 12-like isoform X2 n=1 Tax=Megalops cyprinoides TaxID=118141 RepID=UPI00186407E9|nr:ankyrin repeat domain-containing protein 12-like isoform X2 [Megalops cyprinoides]